MIRQTKRYSKVSLELWGDDKFLALTPMRPSGQALWTYLLTSPYRSVIPGLTLNIGLGTIADRLPSWSLAATTKHWDEIVALNMAKADWRAGVIWLPKAIVHNEPEAPNVIRHWATVALPRCALVDEALMTLGHHIQVSMGEAFTKAFHEAFGEAFRKGLAKGLPQGIPEDLPKGYADTVAVAVTSTPPIVPPKGGNGRSLPQRHRGRHAQSLAAKRDQEQLDQTQAVKRLMAEGLSLREATKRVTGE